MAASAGAWYRVGKVNVTNDSQSVVGVDTNWQSDVIAIAIGDIFTLDAKTWYEVTAVNSDTSITLDRGFEGSTSTNKTYAIVRNTSGTILTRIAGQVSVQFNQKQLFLDELRTWLNSDNATEELTDSHGLKQSLKTPSQMVRDHDEKLAELDTIHPYPWAMRKVEFEARRAANNEKFAASGFVHFGKHSDTTATPPINEGMFTRSDGQFSQSWHASKLWLGRNDSYASGSSKENSPTINIAGVLTTIYGSSGTQDPFDGASFVVKFPPAEDGTRTYDSATGISVTHATPAIAFASETDSNKVVTDRVDMWGFEAFLREINDADPFVYSKGLIQSLAPDINGVATVTNNTRPSSHFAWYEGDESSRGKGVNWQTATESQRRVIASDPENNIYFDDATGKFYQWSPRGRSFAGSGNGDWDTLEDNNRLLLTHSSHVNTRATVQANLDQIPNNNGNNNYLSVNNSSGINKQSGVFSVKFESVDGTVDGESYFLVCGTVNRLNQGAYHPSFNPSGSRGWRYKIDQTTNVGSWANFPSTTVISKPFCFELLSHTDGAIGASNYGGNIAQGTTGRPDGRYYDAIYASGQGGVCRDMRYSAWGLTQEDFAEADLAVKSGEYRGLEKQQHTRVLDAAAVGSGTHALKDRKVYAAVVSGRNMATILIDTDQYPYTVGDTMHLYNQTRGRIVSGQVYAGSFNYIYIYNDGAPIENWTDDTIVLIHSRALDTPVAGEFTHTDVIGNPAEIRQCGALKDGWVGSWTPAIPNDSTIVIKGTVPCVDHVKTFSTADQGATWSATSPVTFENTDNAQVAAFSANAIWVVVYTTKAGMTQDSVNTKIYGGETGIGRIDASSSFRFERGAFLNYSLARVIQTNTNYDESNGKRFHSKPSILDYAISWELEMFTLAYSITHQPLLLGVPKGTSGACKSLNYNVVENQQGFINYAYTELAYDDTASDWGDDGKIHIADNQTTMLDTNGNTVKVGTARIVEPLGWIKNDK